MNIIDIPSVITSINALNTHLTDTMAHRCRGVMSGWGYSACKVTTQDTDIPGEELQSLAPA